jgi:hypothetical protein
MDQERRRAPRFTFIASAEVLAEAAGMRLAARVSDNSASGCYVDTINPLVDGDRRPLEDCHPNTRL